MLYSLRKDGKMWTVITPSGVVQFRSMNKKNCQEWIDENTPKNE